MTRPSLTEMRAVCQPTAVVGRRSGEHWAGRWWGRKISIHITRLLAPTRITPDAVTALMIGIGLLASASLLVPGVLGAVGAVLAIQVYLVADCVDGELARWRGTTSMRGAYLDRVGHYAVEAALFSVYGFHVERTWASGWTSLSLAAAVLHLINKAETDLVLAVGGTGGDTATVEQLQPRTGVVRGVRRLLHPLKIHRLTGAAEATLVMLAAAIAVELGWEGAGRAAIALFAAISAGLAVGHGVSIATSGRLQRPDT